MGDFALRVRFGSEREETPIELRRLSGAAVLGLTAWSAASGAAAVTADAQGTADADASVSDVVVTGVRPLLGDKIPLSVKDTPQSVNVLPVQLLDDQGVTRLQDALKNVPGITLNAGEGAARGDTVNLRGFSAFNDFFLDGIRDAAVYNRDTFDLQQVEVLKGPSATLFGRGSTGGVINQVSKAPGLEPFRTLFADVGSNDEFRADARRRPAAQRHLGGAPQCDGRVLQRRGPRLRAEPALGRRAGRHVRDRRAHDGDPRLHAPDRERSPGHRRSVRERRPGAGSARS